MSTTNVRDKIDFRNRGQRQWSRLIIIYNTVNGYARVGVRGSARFFYRYLLLEFERNNFYPLVMEKKRFGWGEGVIGLLARIKYAVRPRIA